MDCVQAEKNMALRKNPERKNPESGKRNNPESENLECINPEWEKI